MSSIGHNHHRKNKSKKKKTDLQKVADNSVLAVTFFGLVMTVPQIASIWISHNVSGISLLAWVAYTITAIFWIFYGYVHKEKTIIAVNVLWVLFNFSIVLGVFLYAKPV